MNNSFMIFQSYLQKMKKIPPVVYLIIDDLFFIGFIFYLFCLWMDSAFNQFISDYFNLNIILGLIVIAGIIMVVRKEREDFK